MPAGGFLARSTAALLSTSVLTSALGFVYWALAARLFPATVVGGSATAIAAMNLVAPFTTLGLGTLLLGRLPAMAARRGDLVVSAALLSGTAGGVLALVVALLLPSPLLGLPGIGVEVGATVLFAAGVAAQGVGTTLDAALLGVEGGGPQLRRNAAHAVVKLVLVVAFALLLSSRGSLSIYASWFVANVVSIAGLALWLGRRRGVAWSRLRPSTSVLRGLPRHAARHHALNLSLQVPFLAMPIVANVVLGSAQAGYLYATWAVAGFVFVLPHALSTALFASGSRDAASFPAELRVTLRWSLLACLLANVVIAPLGGPVLHVFGAEYAASGRSTLVLVCVAGLGLVVKDHHVAVARVTGRIGREAALLWVLTVLEVAAAVLGASRDGLRGLAAGWLLVVLLEAAVCAPLVLRAYRGRLPGLVRVPVPTAPAGTRAVPGPTGR